MRGSSSPRDRLKGKVNRGAFVVGRRYVRLITYARLQDLRAPLQRFRRLTGTARAPRAGSAQRLRAPAYMGPGVWFGRGRVHVRLSHTRKWLPELAAYRGPVVPRQVRLALARESDVTLQVLGSQHVRFRQLTIGGGGDFTVRVHNVSGVEFDHVEFRSATHGGADQRGEGPDIRSLPVPGRRA